MLGSNPTDTPTYSPARRPHCCLPGPVSDELESNRDSQSIAQALQVSWVAAHDDVVAGRRSDDNGGVDHIERSRSSTHSAGRSSTRLVEWLDAAPGQHTQHLRLRATRQPCPRTPAGTVGTIPRSSERRCRAQTRRSLRSAAMSAPVSSVRPPAMVHDATRPALPSRIVAAQASSSSANLTVTVDDVVKLVDSLACRCGALFVRVPTSVRGLHALPCMPTIADQSASDPGRSASACPSWMRLLRPKWPGAACSLEPGARIELATS